jgi:CheY-like chemotaxis protein
MTGQPIRILLVEDDLLNRGLMMEQFKNAGFNSIIVAENGREAVDLVLQHNPDLVLMDIQMPGMDGNEAIAALKEKGYTGPIVALSASAMKEDIEKSLNAGAADFITKPLDFDTILLKVEKYFKKQMSPEIQDAAPEADRNKSLKKDEIKGKGEKNGDEYRYESGYRITASASKRIQDVFIKEAKEKLKMLNEAADEDSLKQRKKEITFISHGYKSNARLLGLLSLETAAIELNSALKKNEPGKKLIELVKKLSHTLKRIIEENEKKE